MADEGQNDLEPRLRRLIETIDIARALTEPIMDSIDRLLEVSAAQLNSEEASVLVRAGDDGDLKFLTAIGRVADQITGMNVPAGKGIAGFVLMSGQPMAVSDAGGQETFYAEVDRATGYTTQTILAAPLRFNDEIIGVLEYVNRRGEPPFAPFTSDELDKAGVYADAIAALVSAHGSASLLRGLSSKLLSGSDDETDLAAIREWIATQRISAGHTERLELAVLLNEIAARGEAERGLCRELLETILRFSDTKTESGYLSF